MPGAAMQSRLVSRRTLVERIGDSPFVVLAAPGGWGKSTLCDQLVRSFGVATARVGLKGPVQVNGLVASMRRASRRAGLSDLVEALASDDPDDALDGLIAMLAARADPVTIFVDDAQFLDLPGEKWLADLAEELPDRDRLIVAGRGPSNTLLGRYRSRVALIGIDDLRFDEDDVATALGVDRDRPVVRAVAEVSNGWPAAVGVAAARVAADPAWLPAPGAAPDLMDWLLADLLRGDTDMVARLSALPLLDRTAADLACGDGAFDRIVETGLPLYSVGEQWVAIPDPIRESFTHRPGLDAPVVDTLARHYADSGELAVAAQWLLDRKAFDALAALLAERHWTEWEPLGLTQVAVLVERLGRERLARWPRLIVSACRVAETRDPELHRSWLALGRGLADADDRVLNELAAEEARRLVRTGDEPGALALAQDVLERAPVDDLVARGRASMVVGISEALIREQGHGLRARTAMDDAVALLRLAGEPRLESEALLHYGYNVSFNGGQPARAAEQLASCLALVPASSRDYASRLTYYADVLDELGRTGEAEEAARRAFEIGQRLADAQAIGFGAWAVAHVLAHDGDVAGAHEWAAVAEAHPGAWFASFHGVEYFGAMADTLLRHSPDSGWERYRDRLLERDRSFAEGDIADSIHALEMVLFGDPFEAEKLLDRVETSVYQPDRTQWALTLERALAKLRQGDEDAARLLVADALTQTSLMGVPDLPLRHHRHVAQQLASVWPEPQSEGSRSDGITRVRILGGFAIVRGSEDVTPPEGNPCTLVKLLALRSPMTTDEAVDLVWPDADLVTGRTRLRNLLNRIRSRSGDLIERRGDMLVLSDELEVDAFRFEAAAAEALRAEPARRAGLARLALDAYGGDLLPGDVYEDWAAAPRERLRRRYLSLLDVVAADALERGELDEAVRVLDAAIEVEPLGETRYVEAARALLVQGRLLAASTLVGRALMVLDDLGVEPAPDLADLAAELEVSATTHVDAGWTGA